MIELAELLGDRAASVQVVDIDADVDLARKYSDRIPFVCSYRLDAARVRRYLDN
jgi:hypothetical protein